MRITHLQVSGLRAFKQAQFNFTSGMNLLVGVNGVGKTTVLDALCVCLSRVLPEVTASRSRPLSFSYDDINVNASALTVDCGFDLEGNEYTLTLHKQRESNVPRKNADLRRQTIATPDIVKIQPAIGSSVSHAMRTQSQPLGLLFSTRRSLVSETAPSKMSASGGQASAFADALSSRELRLSEIAFWMRAQEALSKERQLGLKHLSALRRAVSGFLPRYKNLRASSSPKPQLIVDKGKSTLDVRQLSDGERGLLVLGLDLARRLSQANPTLPDPIKQGRGIVLIDELDLHLHPKWQRTIVNGLTRTFPHCQFIVTTHSPQIVAAVEPEQVQLLTATDVVIPNRTLGMDSNWILRHLMEAEDRPVRAMKAINEVEALIKKGAFKKARVIIEAKRKAGLDLTEWSVLEARMARMEILAR